MFGLKKITFKGKDYAMNEVVSAFQKALRRGEHEAHYWAAAMHAAGNWNAAFNRLKIICMEDASATLRLVDVVHACHQRGMERIKAYGKPVRVTNCVLVPKCEDDLLVAVEAVRVACKSRCLRCVSAWVCALTYRNSNVLCVGRNRLLAEAKDGRAVGKNEVVRLFKEAIGEHKASFEDVITRMLGVLVWEDKALIKEFWKAIEGNCPAPFGNTIKALRAFSENHLYLAGAQAVAVTRVARKKGTYPAFSLDLPTTDCDLDLIRSRLHVAIEIPEIAIDKHTGRGRARGAGVKEFFENGALVTNEPFPDPWRDESYRTYAAQEQKGGKAKSAEVLAEIRALWAKAFPDAFPEAKRNLTQAKKNNSNKRSASERDEEEEEEDDSVKRAKPKKRAPEVNSIANLDVVRNKVERVDKDPMGYVTDPLHVQYPCAKKPPAIVGVLNLPGDRWHGKRVFLKGPESEEHALTQLWCAEVKDVMVGIRTIETRVLKFGIKSYYILQPGLDHGSAGTEQREKNGVMLTIAVPGSGTDVSRNFQAYLNDCKNLDAIPKPVQMAYVLILLYRQLLGLTDTCHRNIFIDERQDKDAELYSIDETRTGREVLPKLIGQLSSVMEIRLRAWLQKHKGYCDTAMRMWQERLAKEDVAKYFAPTFVLDTRFALVRAERDRML